MQNRQPDTGLLGRIAGSIFRGPLVPRDDSERRWVVFHHLVLHFRPVRVRRSTIRYTHTFGLGGMGLLLFLLLASSGALLLLVYEPSPAAAHDSLQHLDREVLFGPFVRSVHHWSANLLLLVLFLHLLRVFFTGGYYPPRQFNWVIGLGLMLLVMASSFTGYLLPWDQLSYWAVTISLGMLDYVPAVGERLQGMLRGGPEVGASTLVRFYALHTTVLPALLIALMALHFWRVRKDKGVVEPRDPDGESDPDGELVLALPNLLLKEMVVGLLLIALVLGLAAAGDVPLGERANPGMSPNPAKAPWYFVGFQELLIHVPPVVAVLWVPLLALLALALLPYLRRDGDGEGVWFVSRRGRRMAAIGAAVGLVATIAWVMIDELRSPGGEWAAPIVGVAGLAAFHLLLRRRLSAGPAEALQGTFSLLVVALAILTIIGVWFRGTGMELVWPGTGR